MFVYLSGIIRHPVKCVLFVFEDLHFLVRVLNIFSIGRIQVGKAVCQTGIHDNCKFRINSRLLGFYCLLRKNSQPVSCHLNTCDIGKIHNFVVIVILRLANNIFLITFNRFDDLGIGYITFPCGDNNSGFLYLFYVLLTYRKNITYLIMLERYVTRFNKDLTNGLIRPTPKVAE